MALDRWSMARGEDGSTQIFMMLGMLAALFLTVLAVQVARANDLRSRAITAADSTAIAAVTPLRDEAVDLALSGSDPEGLGLWAVADHTEDDPLYNQVARAYAERNGSTLAEKVRPSGMLGHTMRAAVQTKDCVIKKDDELTEQDRRDLRDGKRICVDNSGRRGIVKGRGTAVAFAELRLPDCATVPIGPVGPPASDSDGAGLPFNYELNCDGVRMWDTYGYRASRSDVLRLFKIRLVSKEDGTEYKGPVFGPGGEGFGRGNWDVGDICASSGGGFTAEHITPRMECVRDQIRKKFIVPKGIGCYRYDTMGEHPLGRACDFMISNLGWPENQGQVQLGFDIANWAVANAARLGIYYVIYRQHIWNIFRAAEGWRLMEDRGSPTQNHMDHVHISVQP